MSFKLLNKFSDLYDLNIMKSNYFKWKAFITVEIHVPSAISAEELAVPIR